MPPGWTKVRAPMEAPALVPVALARWVVMLPLSRLNASSTGGGRCKVVED